MLYSNHKGKNTMAAIKESVYIVADLPFTACSSADFLAGAEDQEIRRRIRTVIKTEAPITEWLLIKRVINSFDIWKAGSNIRTMMISILADMNLHSSVEYDTVIFWKRTQNPASYSEYRLFGKDDLSCRDVTNVPVPEIANAMAAVLKKNGSMEYEELARAAAELLGYSRMGSNVREAMQHAAEYGTETRKFRRRGSVYTAARGN